VQIITNNKPRFMTDYLDLPQEQQDDYFILHGEDAFEQSYIQYKGIWYCLGDFVRTDENFPSCWAGYSSDSFFSGVLIRFSHDEDFVVMGTYLS